MKAINAAINLQNHTILVNGNAIKLYYQNLGFNNSNSSVNIDADLHNFSNDVKYSEKCNLIDSGSHYQIKDEFLIT